MIVDVNDKRIVNWIKEGKVFIYPTDTVYGLGCDATNKESVQRIRNIKNSKKPFSVIAPSKEWIKEHCKCGEELEKLPGPFTFVYDCDFKVECNNNEDTLGIRIPEHEFTKKVKEANIPFVTTSINKTGEEPIQSLAQLSLEIYNKVDIIIDVGPIKGKSSTVIDYTQDPPQILRT